MISACSTATRSRPEIEWLATPELDPLHRNEWRVLSRRNRAIQKFMEILKAIPEPGLTGCPQENWARHVSAVQENSKSILLRF